MIDMFAALAIGVLGFALGSLAAFVLWMKSEDRDLKRGYIEIAGGCYQLRPMEDPLLSHRRRMPATFQSKSRAHTDPTRH
jgi:hypothetical protein